MSNVGVIMACMGMAVSVANLVVVIYPISRINTRDTIWGLIKRVYNGEYGIIESICIWLNTVCFMINLELVVRS